MAYTVLARKYRSQTFDEVVGQEPIAQTLKNAIKNDRVAHAYLFTGTRGIGKTTMARILAKALNCLSYPKPTTTPCLECESCRAINLGQDIDVIEIDGASNNSVDQVRKIRENAIYRPARSRFKIYIIDEVHMLSTGAFNALLKTLEEPPSHVKFIFATTEPNKVIATIQSRCQRFDFSNIRPELIARQLRSILKQEEIEFEDELILPLAKMANGSMRDALSLLDRLISTGVQPLTVKLLEDYLGQPNSEKIYRLIEKIADSDAAGTLAAVDELVRGGIGEAQVVDSLIDYMRDILVVKSAGRQTELVVLTEQQRERSARLAEKFDIAALVYNITSLEKLRWSITHSNTPRALLDAAMIRFALSEHFINIDQLLYQGGQTRSLKKNNVAKSSTNPTGISPTTQSPSNPVHKLPVLDSIEAIKQNWKGIIELVSNRLGAGTAALLSDTEPSNFQDGKLTLAVTAQAHLSKQMLESNGRKEQLQSLFSELCRRPIQLQLESQQPQATESPRPDTDRRKNELINDPAVRTVIVGLDATITRVEEHD